LRGGINTFPHLPHRGAMIFRASRKLMKNLLAVSPAHQL
jgi:hypothetical protein